MYFSQDCEGEILSALSSADIFRLISQTSMVVWKRLPPAVSDIWTLGPQLAMQYWESTACWRKYIAKGGLWVLYSLDPLPPHSSCFTFAVEVISPLPVPVAMPATCCHASCHDGLISLQVSSISLGVWSQQQKSNINRMTQRVQEDVWKYKFKCDVILWKIVNIWRRLYSWVRWKELFQTSHCTYYTWYPDTVCLTVTLSGLKSFNYGSIISSWNDVSQTLVTKEHYRILGFAPNALTHLGETQMPHP